MFFLLRRRPPASTLFPTRRSSDLAVAFAPRRRAACERERDAARPRRRCSSRAHLGGRGGLVLAPLAAAAGRPARLARHPARRRRRPGPARPPARRPVRVAQQRGVGARAPGWRLHRVALALARARRRLGEDARRLPRTARVVDALADGGTGGLR